MTAPGVIIDTDPGVDDAVAILVALASPEIDLLGVSAVAGNVPLKAAIANAAGIVGLSGRSDVPVRAGAAAPLARDQVFGKYAAIGSFGEDIVGRQTVSPDPENAVHFLVRQALAAAEEGGSLTVCAIGPMTNIALALIQEPAVQRGIGRIVAMGGAFSVPGHRTPWAEFNFFADPHAAEAVFRSGIPVTLMPLDVTCQALFTVEHIDRFRAVGGRPGAAIADLMTRFDRSDVARYGRPGGPIHDAMTIAWLVDPSMFSGRAAAVGVEVAGLTKGQAHADFLGRGDRAASVTLIDRVDEARFLDFIVGRMARYGDGDLRLPAGA